MNVRNIENVRNVERYHENAFTHFEKEIRKIARLKKFRNYYIVNGEAGWARKSKNIICLFPYCLKLLECKYRTKRYCDFESNPSLCARCIVKKLVDFIERENHSRKITYYIIVNDSRDLPRAVRSHIRRAGMFDGVIAISCPVGVVENKDYFVKYPVPVLFFPLKGWEECNFEKAARGKFWGKTYFDLDALKEAWQTCLSS